MQAALTQAGAMSGHEHCRQSGPAEKDGGSEINKHGGSGGIGHYRHHAGVQPSIHAPMKSASSNSGAWPAARSMPSCRNWFAELTSRKLRRSAHRSVTELEGGIRKWINEWNKGPRPFAWTKGTAEILETLAASCRRTLA